MTEFNFDAKLSAAELYAFSMRHTYKSMSGIFGLIISFGSLIICAVRYYGSYNNRSYIYRYTAAYALE